MEDTTIVRNLCVFGGKGKLGKDFRLMAEEKEEKISAFQGFEALLDCTGGSMDSHPTKVAKGAKVASHSKLRKIGTLDGHTSTRS